MLQDNFPFHFHCSVFKRVTVSSSLFLQKLSRTFWISTAEWPKLQWRISRSFMTTTVSICWPGMLNLGDVELILFLWINTRWYDWMMINTRCYDCKGGYTAQTCYHQSMVTLFWIVFNRRNISLILHYFNQFKIVWLVWDGIAMTNHHHYITSIWHFIVVSSSDCMCC